MTFLDDNVQLWFGTDTLRLDRYYTKLDTIAGPNAITSHISALVEEGDSIEVDWFINNEPVIYKDLSKVWKPTVQKWRTTSAGSYSFKRENVTIPVKTSVLFRKSGKLVTREKLYAIVSKAYHYDIFRVNYGMSRQQVKQNEEPRGFGPDSYYEPTPSVGVLNFSTSMKVEGTRTYYEFENNKLKRVSELAVDPIAYHHVLALATKYSVPERPYYIIYTNKNQYQLNKEQTWTNGKFRFTLSHKEVELKAGEKQKCFAVTYDEL